MRFIKVENGYLELSRVLYVNIGKYGSYAYAIYFHVALDLSFAHSHYSNLEDADNAMRHLVDNLNKGVFGF